MTTHALIIAPETETAVQPWSSPASSGLNSEQPPDQRLTDLEAVFGALAHEQRRDILLTLKSRSGGMTAGAIADRFACSWPSTTRHLRVLEDAGLVMMERRGRERLYKLSTGRLLDVAGRWLERFDDRENLERPSSANP